MPLTIQDASLSDRLRRFFKLRGRTPFSLDETVVPVAVVQDLGLPIYPQRLQYFEGTARLTGAVLAGKTRAFTISVDFPYGAFQSNLLGPGSIVREGGLAMITHLAITNLEGGQPDLTNIAIAPSPFNWMWNSGTHQVIQQRALSVNRWTPRNAVEGGANTPDKVGMFLQGTNEFTLAFTPGDSAVARRVQLEDGETVRMDNLNYVMTPLDQLGVVEVSAPAGTEGWLLEYGGIYDPLAGQ